MATETDSDFAGRIVSETEAYAAQLQECVRLLSDLLDRYAGGGPYRETVERIQELESECDRSNRELGALVTNATADQIGLRNSRIHLNSPTVVELYQRLDEIANAAERIAEELATVQPAREKELFDRFREIGRRATEAMNALAEAITTFVRLLSAPSETGSIAREIETVREVESACDGLRNDAIAAAFADESIERPLLYREFAHLLDGVVDAIEDAVDRIVVLSSDESWIETESDRGTSL